MKTYGLWRPVMNGAKAPITLPVQKQTTHTTATFDTTADYMVHCTSGATKSKLHNSVLQSCRSRYLQIPDCYKLSNGRFDVHVEHFLPVFYFHVLALNCTDTLYSNCQLHSLGYQSKPFDIFMNLLSSSLPFTFFQSWQTGCSCTKLLHKDSLFFFFSYPCN